MTSKTKTKTETETDAGDAAQGAVELSGSDPDRATGGVQHSFLSRLYTGTGAFEVVGRRKLWYGISGGIVTIAILSIIVRGFTFGIDFKGGTTVSFPRGDVKVTEVEEVFHKTLGSDPESVVTVGNGASATVQIRSKTLSNAQTEKLRDALFDAFHPKGADGKPSKKAISDAAVSETWGGQITKKAVIALVVFLVLVAIYITVRYERYMTISAIAAMVFDLTVTAGVYALVGFEVTPATVIGLLTILGFSIYDTVIVFDKVEENTNGFQHTTRRTFAEQANLAVNQTFMRSINTSLISVLPVVALMVVAVWLLGVGTLKDLALVQLIGIIVGTYSSIFFATPLLVTLRERTDLVRTHTRRVLKRRGAASPVAAEQGEDTAAELTESAVVEASPQSADHPQKADSKPAASTKPAPGPGRCGPPAPSNVRRASETPAGGRSHGHLAPPRRRQFRPVVRIAESLARQCRRDGRWYRCDGGGGRNPDRLFGECRRPDRLRRRRCVADLQHQHRHRRRLCRSAGVCPGAHRLRLSRARRSGRRRPRLRHHLGGRRLAAGARLSDRRQCRLFRR
ncbi:protein-export membrane protein SecF [Mycobacterium kansasii 662]|uniref:Protein-export membrane protein SecF n=2 Tax=Mycobacterium kansasii TaxID=1768 RepID=A0A1V3WH20_MYCKA|nr:protein-export membrane protein SecF [Mycobacterium kansasii 662]OOK66205.1 protein-export membrane protein SecF [Mycobacterium kansasii]OOK82229.1 protein-export membrane protein SecF [Mycobacterium kansasii]